MKEPQYSQLAYERLAYISVAQIYALAGEEGIIAAGRTGVLTVENYAFDR